MFARLTNRPTTLDLLLTITTEQEAASRAWPDRVPAIAVATIQKLIFRTIGNVNISADYVLFRKELGQGSGKRKKLIGRDRGS